MPVTEPGADDQTIEIVGLELPLPCAEQGGDDASPALVGIELRAVLVLDSEVVYEVVALAFQPGGISSTTTSPRSSRAGIRSVRGRFPPFRYSVIRVSRSPPSPVDVSFSIPTLVMSPDLESRSSWTMSAAASSIDVDDG